jgi:adenine-specific DNA-methyltransferase
MKEQVKKLPDTHGSDLGQPMDIAAGKRRELQAVIPEAFTEGKLNLAALKLALGEIVEAGERYGLGWAGKADAYKVLQSPTSATLRPQIDKSINFNEASHVFVEGENLEVLKVLQKAYFGKVKRIYIDPPYNTGSDSFVYPDRFHVCTGIAALKRVPLRTLGRASW